MDGSFWKVTKLGLAWEIMRKGQVQRDSQDGSGDLTSTGPVPPPLGFCPLLGVEKQLSR